MVAEVSRQIKSEAQFDLITRDFLGGAFGIESNEFDLDFHVPYGWEKCLDLQSGKITIQRNSSAKSSTNTNPTLSLLEERSLDLNLLSTDSPSSTYTSVCTLEKVKIALDKAERASPSTSLSSSSRKRPAMSNLSPSPSPSPSNSSLSTKGEGGEDERESSTWPSQPKEGLLVAAACPGCFLYVLISKNDPNCPKCCSVVQFPNVVVSKKPKIDLNISI